MSSIDSNAIQQEHQSTCINIASHLYQAPKPQHSFLSYAQSFGSNVFPQKPLEVKPTQSIATTNTTTNFQQTNSNVFRPIIVFQQPQPQNTQIFSQFPLKYQQAHNLKVEEDYTNNTMNHQVLKIPNFKLHTENSDLMHGVEKHPENSCYSFSPKNSLTVGLQIPATKIEQEMEDNDITTSTVDSCPRRTFHKVPRCSAFQKHKKIQEKQQKQTKSNNNAPKRVNTSHVPLNMYNQLYFHLQDLYKNKLPCKCNEFRVKQEENSVTLEEEQLCVKCSEWKKIEVIKKLKKKNIETFRLLWGISKRVQILSENFFLNHATISILSNKMYRTAESKQAVYTCLPNFVQGSRNYTTFYRILG